MAKVMTEEQIAARRERIAKRASRPPTKIRVAEEVHVRQGNLRGRPSLKSPAIIDDILAGVASGRSLATVCASDPKMPDVRNVYRWMEQDEGFRLAYLRACSNRSLVYADTIGDIAQATLSGKIDPNAARVAINAYQWVAARLSANVYGEKQEVTVNHQHLHLHALRQLSEAAKVGQAAIAQRELELQALPGDGVEVAQAPPGGPDGGGRLLQQQPLLTDTIPPTDSPAYPATSSYPASPAYPATSSYPAPPETPETEQQPPVTG